MEKSKSYIKIEIYLTKMRTLIIISNYNLKNTPTYKEKTKFLK